MKRVEINSFSLKMIAIICMFIDHMTAAGIFVTSNLQYTIGRGIGRIAFPLFCFLLVEGYFYSRDRMKYLARLLFLAFVSEIPFDLVFRGSAYNMEYQNVFFTLSLGLAAVMMLGKTDRKFMGMANDEKRNDSEKRFYKFLNIIIQLAILTFMTTMAELLRTDYSANGVLLIVMIYFFEKFYPLFSDSVAKYGEEKVKNMLAAFAVFLWIFFYDMKGGSVNEGFGVPVIMLIYLYNGKRGNYRLHPWFFYAFYPLHLLLIAALRKMIYGI